MTQNLSHAHANAAAFFQVEYLEQKDIPSALSLIERIRTSGTLQQNYHLKPRTADELIQLLKDGYPLLGIKNEEGELAAFTSISPLDGDDNSFILRSLCTSPDSKGQGFAKKLLTAALNWMNQNGGGNLTARVAQNNTDSLAIFLKSGFHQADLLWDDKEKYMVCIMAQQCPNHAESIPVPDYYQRML
ncbi:MAG: hypothetical protein A3J37_01335 [Alphaproteobacteria bacterium RIFCSPHIGHO2_12_FULL_45_9]|nr:MAG: hypothetical protein A3B66_06120 [Alphaproteobacteria bacterium RIFCSPHIGHO2_02_FULL_46_13]OFW98952.1 MAG: hypothetical protein A3J37_01335 [Alphaproteobacteria bacterium RIFCSPHIGHO2_12_FULL_45_9]